MKLIILMTSLLITTLAQASNSLPVLLDQFYKSYVVTIPSASYDSQVDYKRLRKDLRRSQPTRENFMKIEDEIAQFEKTNKSKDELVAFYTNAYNFLTIKLIIDNYRKFLVRLPSIVLIDLNKEGPWKNHFFQVAGERVSLDDIEHRILREEILNFQDGRIHFALNCASRGCPPLLNESFKSERLEEQLNHVTTSGLKLERMVRIENGVTSLSSIFDWFLPDFENERGSVENFILHYSNRELIPTATIKHHKYNWCLNHYSKRPINLRLCSLI